MILILSALGDSMAICGNPLTETVKKRHMPPHSAQRRDSSRYSLHFDHLRLESEDIVHYAEKRRVP